MGGGEPQAQGRSSFVIGANFIIGGVGFIWRADFVIRVDSVRIAADSILRTRRAERVPFIVEGGFIFRVGLIFGVHSTRRVGVITRVECVMPADSIVRVEFTVKVVLVGGADVRRKID